MFKFLQVVFLVAIATLSNVCVAQGFTVIGNNSYIVPPGCDLSGPQIPFQSKRCMDGRYVGPPPQGMTSNYGQYNGQYIPIPQGVAYGQPFNAVLMNGQQVRVSCSLADRAISAGVGAVVASIGADAFNRLAHKKVIDRTGASEVGALVGAFGPCTDWTGNSSVQQVQQGGYPLQQGGYPQQGQYGQQPVRGSARTVVNDPSKCFIDGQLVATGITFEECEQKKIAKKTFTPERIEVAEVSLGNNACVRNRKKYDCGDKFPAFFKREGSDAVAIVCVFENEMSNPGISPCTGIK